MRVHNQHSETRRPSDRDLWAAGGLLQRARRITRHRFASRDLGGASARLTPGIDFKVLRATQETGHWTVLLKCAKGSGIPRHEHLGAGEYYVVAGKMEVRGGVENGGITAITGDYGYEPNGVIHDMTNFPEDTVLYFTNFGPIRYIDDDDNTTGFLDWQGVLKAAEEAKAKIA